MRWHRRFAEHESTISTTTAKDTLLAAFSRLAGVRAGHILDIASISPSAFVDFSSAANKGSRVCECSSAAQRTWHLALRIFVGSTDPSLPLTRIGVSSLDNFTTRISPVFSNLCCRTRSDCTASCSETTVTERDTDLSLKPEEVLPSAFEMANPAWRIWDIY